MALTIVGIAKDKVVSSAWTAAPLNVDGLQNDWTDDVLNSEKKVAVDYAFRNDAENLYVLFIIKNRKYLSSIAVTGLNVWLSDDGKKSKKYGINFRAKQITADEYIALLQEKVGSDMPEERKTQIRSIANYIMYDHKVINEEGDAAEPSEELKFRPALFRTKGQQNAVIYELAVPLKRVHDLAPGVGVEPGNSVKVGFQWGGWTKELKEAQASKIGQSGTKARADGATGLTGERRAGSGASASLTSMRRATPKEYSFWVEVNLAQNN
jgi:hypothetical protein